MAAKTRAVDHNRSHGKDRSLNLVSGAVTMLMGIAGAISIAMIGFIFHAAGHLQAFMIFAVIAGMATLSVWFLLPETKPARYAD